MFAQLATALEGVDELCLDACGTENSWSTFLAGDDYDAPLEVALGANPTTRQIAYVFGLSLGRPIAYLRAINQSGNVLGLNYFVMLVFSMLAGMSWIAFVIIISYSARLIMAAKDTILEIYKLIPFKFT